MSVKTVTNGAAIFMNIASVRSSSVETPFPLACALKTMDVLRDLGKEKLLGRTTAKQDRRPSRLSARTTSTRARRLSLD